LRDSDSTKRPSIYKKIVEEYWGANVRDLPALFVVANILLKCSASEAEVERLFSSEALIHSKNRNRMSNESAFQHLFVRWNYDTIAENVDITSESEFDDPSDVEEMDY